MALTSCRATEPSTEIRFAFQNRVGSAIPIIAVEKGFFRQEGLNISPLRFNSGPECAEALYTGSADIGTMGDATALIALAKNPSMTVITRHASGEHRHRIMVARNSTLRSVEDLRGKTVAIKKGTSTYGGFLKLLDNRGVDPSSVRITDLSPSAMIEALLAGSIDAFVASEPTPSAAEENGGREIATLGGLGNNYPVLMIARRGYLEKHEKAVRHFMNALKKAENFIRENPSESVVIVGKATGLGTRTAAKAMKAHILETGLSPATLSSLERTARFLHKEGLIEKVPDLPSRTYRKTQ